MLRLLLGIPALAFFAGLYGIMTGLCVVVEAVCGDGMNAALAAARTKRSRARRVD